MTLSGKTFKEEQMDADVLVVGAGAGGMMAAITAADHGAKVYFVKRAAPDALEGFQAGMIIFGAIFPAFTARLTGHMPSRIS